MVLNFYHASNIGLFRVLRALPVGLKYRASGVRVLCGIELPVNTESSA
jgi:hypothetical protein